MYMHEFPQFSIEHTICDTKHVHLYDPWTHLVSTDEILFAYVIIDIKFLSEQVDKKLTETFVKAVQSVKTAHRVKSIEHLTEADGVILRKNSLENCVINGLNAIFVINFLKIQVT